MLHDRKPAHKPNNPHHFSPKIQQALASLRLEGETLSPESLEDLALFDKGKITKEEAIKRVLARVGSR